MKPARAFLVSIGLSLLVTTPATAAPSEGDLPPANVGKTFNGEQLVLTNYAGKAVVISFWATWCKYCLQELPILEGIQKQAGKEQIQVIAINTESRDVYRKAARALNDLTLVLAHDPGGKASDAYGVKGIPHMVIIRRDGRIQKIYRGYSESSLDGIVEDINHALEPLPKQ